MVSVLVQANKRGVVRWKTPRLRRPHFSTYLSNRFDQNNNNRGKRFLMTSESTCARVVDFFVLRRHQLVFFLFCSALSVEPGSKGSQKLVPTGVFPLIGTAEFTC